MDFVVFGVVILAIYSIVWFFDSFFKSCMHYPYEAFLKGTGLTIKPFRIQWHTTALNRITIKLAHSYPKVFTHSFDIGVIVSFVLLPLIIVWQLEPFVIGILLNESKGHGHKTSTENLHSHEAQFELLLPGVNLPLDEIVYYIISMGICSVVHEMGHAFAAVLEDVPVTGFGFNVILVLPVAYTHLGSEQMNSIRTWRRLRILCAGIWHNILLAAICFLIISLLPLILTPIYHINFSVIVKSMQKDSPLTGSRGIAVGDIITSINDCRVKDIDSWYKCLVNAIKHPPAYCIPSEYVLEHDESVQVSHTNGVVECCDRSNEKNICFEYMNEEGSYSLIELPQFMCLNVRNTIEHSRAFCHRSSNKCIDSFCIKPMFNNSTTLIQIVRNDQSDVIYIGHPYDLAHKMKVSSFVPKTFLISAHFADGIFLLLKYLVVFSLGLGTLNIIPCFHFDGYHITSTTINYLLQRLVPERHRRECIIIAITSCGSLFLLTALMKSMWYSILRNFA